MRAKSYSASVDNHQSLSDTSEFRTQVMEKINLIASRKDEANEVEVDKVTGDMRMSVTKVLERFQREIIQRSIWIRIYDDHGSNLPAFDPKACQAMEKIIEDALRRHQPGKMLAYIEISFLINEIGTVITVEDNAPSLTVEEIEQLAFLQEPYVTTLSSGYTIQALVSDTDISTVLGQVSVRCVANCFTRFTVCFPH